MPTTIKDLADACRASKPTVKRRLQELGLWDEHVNKTEQPFTVDDHAASAVAASFADGPREAAPGARSDAPPASVVDSLERHISSLERQLDAKDAQIQAMVEQVSALGARLDSMAAKMTDLAEQVARANAIAERPRGLFDRLLGSGKGE